MDYLFDLLVALNIAQKITVVAGLVLITSLFISLSLGKQARLNTDSYTPLICRVATVLICVVIICATFISAHINESENHNNETESIKYQTKLLKKFRDVRTTNKELNHRNSKLYDESIEPKLKISRLMGRDRLYLRIFVTNYGKSTAEKVCLHVNYSYGPKDSEVRIDSLGRGSVHVFEIEKYPLEELHEYDEIKRKVGRGEMILRLNVKLSYMWEDRPRESMKYEIIVDIGGFRYHRKRTSLQKNP